MPLNIFDLVNEAKAAVIEVQLGKVLDDGKPCAVRVKPLRIGDFMVLGGSIPMPSGRLYTEWTTEEKVEYFDYLKKLAPVVVTAARAVEKNPATLTYDETWIPVKVLANGDRPPNREQGELTVDELDSLGDAIVRIGNAVLFETDAGGEIKSLPPDVAGPEFLVGPGHDGSPGVDGGDVQLDAARDHAEPEGRAGSGDPDGTSAVQPAVA